MSASYQQAQIGVIDLETGAQVLPGQAGWSAYQVYLSQGGEVLAPEPIQTQAKDPASTLVWNAQARIARQLRKKLKGLSVEEQLEFVKKEIGL
jgi:hypothetical protein